MKEMKDKIIDCAYECPKCKEVCWALFGPYAVDGFICVNCANDNDEGKGKT